MQTGDLRIEIELPNGIWQCDCIEIADATQYEVMITPPKEHKVKKLSSKLSSVELRYDAKLMEFNFVLWPYEETQYSEELESVLSTKLLKKRLWG